MTATIREEFRYHNVKSFIDNLTTNSLYVGIGRPYFWNIGTSSDATVEMPNSTVVSTLKDWEDMMALKRIYASSLSHGLFRENWAANTKYDIYRHDWNNDVVSVYDGPSQLDGFPNALNYAKWYVVTSGKDIFVCIKQSKTAGVVNPSLYSPDTGIAVGTTGMVKTADGYVWKLVGRTSIEDQTNFMSTSYIPIKTLAAAPGPSDHYYPQWQAQETSKLYKGGIYNIEIVNGGTGYNGGVAGTRNVTDAEADAEFKVIGNGTGLQFTVTYTTGGVISDIEVTNPGAGYTHASVSATGGASALFTIIITPSTGLGVQPARDLLGTFLLVGVLLTGDEGGDFTVLNDYRKISLVINPTIYGSSTIATASTLNACTTLSLSAEVGSFSDDCTITSNTLAKGRSIDYDAGTHVLRIIKTSNENAGSVGANNEFIAAQTITASSGGTATIATVTAPEVQINTGDILYSEYRRPIARSSGQTESLKIIIEM